MRGELLLVGGGAERWMRKDFRGPTKRSGLSWGGGGWGTLEGLSQKGS